MPSLQRLLCVSISGFHDIFNIVVVVVGRGGGRPKCRCARNIENGTIIDYHAQRQIPAEYIHLCADAFAHDTNDPHTITFYATFEYIIFSGIELKARNANASNEASISQLLVFFKCSLMSTIQNVYEYT